MAIIMDNLFYISYTKSYFHTIICLNYEFQILFSVNLTDSLNSKILKINLYTYRNADVDNLLVWSLKLILI